MITVTRTDKATGAVTRLVIPEGKDPVAVLERIAARYGAPLSAEEQAERDARYDALMAARIKEAQGETDSSRGAGEIRPEVVGRPGAESRRGTEDLDREALSNPSRDAAASAPSADVPRSGADLFGAGVPGAAGGRTDAPGDARPPLGLGAVQPRAVGVRGTSRDAYARAKFSGKLTAQQQRVIDWMSLRVGDATRQEIAAGTGIGINAVCGRVNELLAPEIGVLAETGRRRCRVTGETANGLRLVP